MEIVREYTNGELTVIWKPGLSHSRRSLRPDAFLRFTGPACGRGSNPTRATTRQLIEQIECCPSGALSYRLRCGSSGR